MACSEDQRPDIFEMDEIFLTDRKNCEFCECMLATSTCVECQRLACDICVKSHRRIKATARHTIENLANCLSESTRATPVHCEKHPGNELKFYCQTCSFPICSECTIIEHRIPEHKHFYLNETANETRNLINGTLVKVKNGLAYYNQKEANIKQEKKNLTDFKDRAISEVDKHTEELVRKIRQNGQENIKRIKDIFEVKAKVFDSQLDKVETVKSKFKNSLEYSKSLVELGTDAGLMSVHIQAHEKLKVLLKEEIQVEPQVNHHLEYSPNPAFAIGQQGSVTDNKAVASRSVVKYNRPRELCSLMHKSKPPVFQLVTKDVDGKEVRRGGAEVTTEVTLDGERLEMACDIIDYENGTYNIAFRPKLPGTYELSVYIFGQRVEDTPILISNRGNSPQNYYSNCPLDKLASKFVDILSDQWSVAK